MKILFWNIRGMGRVARRRQLREIVLYEKVDVVGIQETIKKEFSQKELRSLVGDTHFSWNWLPAVGHSGGILMGVKQGILEVEDYDTGKHYLSMVIKDKQHNFKWELIVVYGPAHHGLAPSFLQELNQKCKQTNLPKVLGGDFNLIRRAEDKNSSNLNFPLIHLFNDFIAENKLLEIKRGGPRYTWTNKQSCPVMVNLDRVLVTTDWESKFPLCSVKSLIRVGSDHTPILLNSGDDKCLTKGRFYFEKKWFCQDNFREVIKKNGMR